MKIKTDFVTNSSSTSYVISIEKKDYENFLDYFKTLSNHPDAYNEGASIHETIKSIKRLNAYVSDRPSDWVSDAMGINFINMNESLYNDCKKAIEEGKYIISCSVDYNISELFSISAYDGEILSAD